ncbi:hypothetical protein LCGC14_1535290, partial [marine sediment metagenome]
LVLPLDVATQKLAFIGRSGSGKTYGASKLVELMLLAGIQVVVLDGVGVWYGLRLGAGHGKTGFDIPIFGGLHGDVPLEPTGGELIADLLVDRGISAVLDVSMMRKGPRKQFVTLFAEQFFQRKKGRRSPVHVVIEESQMFVPQRPQQTSRSGGISDGRMKGAFEDLTKIGRNFGIGHTLITQRPQAVDKDVLNQIEVLFAFQTNGVHEKRAIRDWVTDKGLEVNLVEELPGLDIGQPWVWSPQWLRITKRVRINRKVTADTSSTPEHFDEVTEPVPLASADMEQLQQDMAATIERAKAEDPKVLRVEVAKLKRELQQKEQQQPEPVVTQVEVPVLAEGQAGLLGGMVDRLHSYLNELKVEVGGLKEALEKVRNGQAARQRPVPRKPVATRPPARRSAPVRDQVADFSGDLPKGERTILIAAAQHGEGVARNQLTVLTGYKRSTRDAYVQRLREKDFVFVNPMGIVEATLSGISALGDDYEPLPTGLHLREYWLGRLPEGERRILEIVIASWPGSAERSDIEEQTGYARSSRDAYIQRLKARRLVAITGPGEVCASENLF